MQFLSLLRIQLAVIVRAFEFQIDLILMGTTNLSSKLRTELNVRLTRDRNYSVMFNFIINLYHLKYFNICIDYYLQFYFNFVRVGIFLIIFIFLMLYVNIEIICLAVSESNQSIIITTYAK